MSRNPLSYFKIQLVSLFLLTKLTSVTLNFNSVLQLLDSQLSYYEPSLVMDHLQMRAVQVKLERMKDVVTFAAPTAESEEDILAEEGPPQSPQSTRGRKRKRPSLPSVFERIEPWVKVREELGNKQRKGVIIDASKHMEDFVVWRPGLALEAIPGHIYFFRGNAQDRYSIAESDNLRWKSGGRSTLKNLRKWSTFYYVAVAGNDKMPFQFGNRISINDLNLNGVTIRKRIIYDPSGLYFVEYSEHASKIKSGQKKRKPRKESEWDDDDPFADFPCSDMDEFSIENPDDLSCNTPSPVMRTNLSPAEESATSDSVQIIDEMPEPTVQRATIFGTSKDLSNLHEIHSVLRLELKDWELQANDMHLTQIVDPQGGENYLMNVSNMDSFDDIFKCDNFSWKRKTTKYWSHFSFVTHKYVLVKDSRIQPEFKRIIDYMPSTKQMLVRYRGSCPDVNEMVKPSNKTFQVGIPKQRKI